jgi:hypothetical protein
MPRICIRFQWLVVPLKHYDSVAPAHSASQLTPQQPLAAAEQQGLHLLMCFTAVKPWAYLPSGGAIEESSRSPDAGGAHAWSPSSVVVAEAAFLMGQSQGAALLYVMAGLSPARCGLCQRP